MLGWVDTPPYPCHERGSIFEKNLMAYPAHRHCHSYGCRRALSIFSRWCRGYFCHIAQAPPHTSLLGFCRGMAYFIYSNGHCILLGVYKIPPLAWPRYGALPLSFPTSIQFLLAYFVFSYGGIWSGFSLDFRVVNSDCSNHQGILCDIKASRLSYDTLFPMGGLC